MRRHRLSVVTATPQWKAVESLTDEELAVESLCHRVLMTAAEGVLGFDADHRR